jgi:hypothetical protein
MKSSFGAAATKTLDPPALNHVIGTVHTNELH